MIAGRRWLFCFSAVAGVVLAHTVDYVLLHPDSGARAHHLAGSGHGYWPAALALAGLGGVLALSGVVLGGARRGLGGAEAGPREPSGAPFATSLALLAACQVVLFTAMEAAERMLTGTAPLALVRAPELRLGLVLQVLVATAVLTLLRFLELVTERVARRLRPRRARFPRVHPGHVPTAWSGGGGPASSARPRGPPHLAAA